MAFACLAVLTISSELSLLNRVIEVIAITEFPSPRAIEIDGTWDRSSGGSNGSQKQR
jgi:hypothetical protein